MKVYNTLSSKKEDFVPLDGMNVKMYVCGITPYDKSHLGHARTIIAFDIMRRYLAFRGYTVTYVQNITDIDDKIINRAKERNLLPLMLSEKYTCESEIEFDMLGIRKPDFSPKVSDYIPQIIDLILKIERNGFAYATKSGVYFDVQKFTRYGRLSKQSMDSIRSGARIEIDEKKKNPQDFALWKFGNEPGAAYDSPWGVGRPGWHIECSAMSRDILGDQLDIHGGAIDLIFPHHENEIAQSESATGKPFVKYWLHTGFLTVNKEKMAKSLGNFITIHDAFKKYRPKQIRFFFACTHYRSPIDFSEEAMIAAGNSLDSLHLAIKSASTYFSKGQKFGLAEEAKKAKERFIAAMDDDFDSPNAFVEIFHLAKLISAACSEGEYKKEEIIKSADLLNELLSLFGLEYVEDLSAAKKREEELKLLCKKLGIKSTGNANDLINSIIMTRGKAREAGDYKKSDEIRDLLNKIGIIIEDKKDGSTGYRIG